MTGQTRDEGVSIERSFFRCTSLKEDRVLEVDRAFARHGWRGCNSSLIIVVERRVLELMCWEIRG